MNLATDLSVTGTEDVTGGIDLSGLVSASSTGGDIVGTFLVYLTRPADDTSASLQAYLAGRGLIDVDASGKVIPGIQLVNDARERVGNFIAEVENDKFFFSVKTAGGENEAFDANIVFPNNFATGGGDVAHDPVMVKVSAVSLGGGGTRAEVAEGDMGTISIEVTGINDAPKVVLGAMTIGEGESQIFTGSANALDPSGILNISDVEGDDIKITPVSSTIEISTNYRLNENSDFYKVQLFESDLLVLPNNITDTFASLSDLNQVLLAISSLNLAKDRYRLMDGPIHSSGLMMMA